MPAPQPIVWYWEGKKCHGFWKLVRRGCNFGQGGIHQLTQFNFNVSFLTTGWNQSCLMATDKSYRENTTSDQRVPPWVAWTPCGSVDERVPILCQINRTPTSDFREIAWGKTLLCCRLDSEKMTALFEVWNLPSPYVAAGLGWKNSHLFVASVRVEREGIIHCYLNMTRGTESA